MRASSARLLSSSIFIFMRRPRCWSSPGCSFPRPIRHPQSWRRWRRLQSRSWRGPIGGALFGHFGDRAGRKKTLVAALTTMGISTFLIGMLPGYASIGIAAPILLALCRFGQGIGLGGEWGGAVLLAVENAPPSKTRALRHVSATGSAGRVSAFGRNLSVAVTPSHRQAVLHVRVAAAVFGELGAGAAGALGAAQHHGDAGVC